LYLFVIPAAEYSAVPTVLHLTISPLARLLRVFCTDLDVKVWAWDKSVYKHSIHGEGPRASFEYPV